MKVRKIFSSLIFISLCGLACAQPLPRGRLPKRMPPAEYENRTFLLANVRISERHGDFAFIDFFFNKRIKMECLGELSILINQTPCQTSDVKFSKDGRRLRLLLRNPPENFIIEITGIESMRGERLEGIIIEDLGLGQIWRKF